MKQLLEEMTMQYSNVGIADEIVTQMKVISEKQNETIGDFGLRLRKVHNCLLTICDSATDLELGDRSLLKSTADRDALQQFLFGLSYPYNFQVRSKRPRSLREAIRLAVDFECKQSGHRRATYPSPIQHYRPSN